MKAFKHYSSLLAAVLVTAAIFAQSGCSKSTPAASAPATTAASGYPDNQYAVLKSLVDNSAAASTALAGEDWAAWEKVRPTVAQSIADLTTTFGPDGFDGLIKRATAAWPALLQAKDFAAARQVYGPVSDNLARIVIVARKADARFTKVMVYTCPMSPNVTDGKWVQLSGPLNNPFYGKEMSDCGDEVKITDTVPPPDKS